MTLSDIARIRLASQQIEAGKHKSAKELVGWMGAMQAQDYVMSKWAVGARLPNVTESDIEKAIAEGDIIRTHLMRPTWHIVSSDDIYWLIDLTAPQIKSLTRSRDKDLELDEATVAKSNKIIEKALLGNKHLTRDVLIPILNQAGIATNDNRASHLFMHAELDGLICSGATVDKKSSFALLSERVPKPASLTKDEALAKLAHKYFASHCPATLRDFIWWSGLSVGNARKAMDMIRAEFLQENIGSETYWLHPSFTVSENAPSAYLLPAYDEFLISYKDRSAMLTPENQQRAFSSNGIFRPVVIVNGQATGVWKRMIKNDKVMIETDFFHPHRQAETTLVELAAQNYARFLGKGASVIHTS